MPPDPQAAQRLYLDLLKRCLTRTLFPEGSACVFQTRPGFVNQLLRAFGLELRHACSAAHRAEGKDWPAEAETMIGLARLQNLQDCIEDVLRNGIPGDLIETGVWRGGACIFMRAVLKVHGDQQRRVWVADSFQGLPRPDPRYPQDAGDRHFEHSHLLAVSLEQVKSNFARYGLLDDQVRFLEGWFQDTLPRAAISQLAVLRMDGDMYSSTMDALIHLYDKLSAGGYAIVDDYGAIPSCRQAVDDFRAMHRIEEPLRHIDWTGVFWLKS